MSANDSAFWRFSLRFYARKGVAPLCLALQDQHGIDVNLLFFILFLSLQGRRLTPADVRRFDQAAAAWRARAVLPLRALRRDLKSGVAPMDIETTAALRAEIQRCELQAERLQQEMLECLFPPASVGAACSVAEAAAANVAAYGAIIGGLPDALVNELLGLFQQAV
jgi:uncharacterized protein (TIGR02444 family)